MDQGLLRADVTDAGAWTLVSLAGEVDVSSVDVLRDALHDAIAREPALVVVDGAALTYLDSTGISCLVDARRDAQRRQATLVVRGTTGIVRRVLVVTGVDAMLCDLPPGDDHAELGQ
jgi:anti-sigma B factor antagonist